MSVKKVKVSFSFMLQHNCSNYRLKCPKDLRVTKIVKIIRFAGVCRKLETEVCFQKQQVTKYLRLTLALVPM